MSTSDDVMTREQLAAIGRAMFGDRWQQPLARALGFAPRHVRRWVRGERPVSRDLRRRLLMYLEDEAARLVAIRRRVERGDLAG